MRPNPIGTSVVKLMASKGATLLVVRGLDCPDGTPQNRPRPFRPFASPTSGDSDVPDACSQGASIGREKSQFQIRRGDATTQPKLSASIADPANSARGETSLAHDSPSLYSLRYNDMSWPQPLMGPRVNAALREKEMRLTLYTDYTLRVLMYVAVADGKLTKINDIAKTFDISKQHLMKIVNDLSRKGYLDTVRGHGGGVRLRRPPRDINIGEVVREVEKTLGVIGCLEQRGYCPIQRVCVLRGGLHDATQAFLSVLRRYTLADLIKPRKALSSLLLSGNAADA